MEQNSLLTKPLIRTRVKYCGITRPKDALHAAEIGVDAIGLVFYNKSPRSVTIEQAKTIADSLPAFVTTVGLFVNADPVDVEKIAHEVNLDLLQFHGDESAAECEGFDQPYIKAIRMREELDLDQLSGEYQNASGLLLDAYDKNLFGGTGKSFDWSMIPDQRSLPIILAGGLDPENVGQAISDVHPYAVDVSGGIEASRGIKDKEKMNAFMRGVNSARS